MRQVRANKYYSIVGTLVRETRKAILVTIQSIQGNAINSKVAIWFPKSQCEDLEVETGCAYDDVEFMASEWILGEKGFAKELEMGLSEAEVDPDGYDAVDFGSIRDLPDSEIPF